MRACQEKRLAALREGRMPSLQRPVHPPGSVRWRRDATFHGGKAECLPSKGPSIRLAQFAGGETRPSVEGRHSAFPRAVRRAEACLPGKAPGGAWGGRMPSPQGRPCVWLSSLAGGGAPPPWREGILPSLAPSGAQMRTCQEKRLAALREAECLPSKGPSSVWLRRGGPGYLRRAGGSRWPFRRRALRLPLGLVRWRWWRVRLLGAGLRGSGAAGAPSLRSIP